jgi:hypothetical protein
VSMWQRLKEVWNNMPVVEAAQAHKEAREVQARADKVSERATAITLRAGRFMDEVAAAQRVVDGGKSR